jgi:hypothetical protein
MNQTRLLTEAYAAMEPGALTSTRPLRQVRAAPSIGASEKVARLEDAACDTLAQGGIDVMRA